ncbi:MAG: FecR domain-containing protein [Balneolaceae bacterium]|nr:FecR domain-containing protein [Balneolaceae bacterium]
MDNQPIRGKLERILSHFSENDKECIIEIWEATSQFAPTQNMLNDRELNADLAAVKERISQSDKKSPAEHISFGQRWRWYLAAAVALLVFGMGFFFSSLSMTAPYGEIKTVALADGSTVVLNSGSSISYSRFYPLFSRTIQLDGEAFFSVKEGNKPFIVHSNDAVVKVTGTSFNVRSWSDQPDLGIQVAVVEGEVQLYHAENSDKAVTVQPGQISSLEPGVTVPAPPDTATVERLIAWREHKFSFNNQTLRHIFRELERRFDVHIQIEDADIAGQSLSAYYSSPTDVESILTDICRVKGLRYARTAAGYKIFR